MKTCPACLTELTLDDFYRNRAQRDGFDHLCKSCRKDVSRQRNVEQRDAEALWIHVDGKWVRSKKATEEWCREHGITCRRGTGSDEAET